MKTRREFLVLGTAACLGCTSPIVRQQSPETEPAIEADVTLVSNYTQPFGLNPIKLEAISLVTGLQGTGEDPAPSPQRAALLEEMQRRSVKHPDQVLASTDTAMVMVRGYLRPGIQKGDKFDVEVRIPPRSETTSLRGGWLLETRLTELAVLAGTTRKGHLMGLAQGPVLVDPSIEKDSDQALQTRGRVLGGGMATKSRSLGLVLNDEHKSVRVSQQVGSAINRRFYSHIRGLKQGVANPKTDEFIELSVHPRYKDNVGRYMRVIRSIAFRETSGGLQARLQLLERQLLDPVTSATAALRLEAVGKEGIPVLLKGIESQDAEARFYAAEALAYLDQTEAAVPLAQIALNEPAYRVYALGALSAMRDVMAHDELRKLLDVPSAETRYGAFRALWEMNPTDPLIRGTELQGQFSYHVLDTQGPPMIHVTRSTRPEIVMFGLEQVFEPPMILEAGKHILVNAQPGGPVIVSRFAVGEPDQKRQVSRKVHDVIHAIIELGGTYPDVVQVLQQAKEKNALPSRFKVDALPKPGRLMDRDEEPAEERATTREEAPSGFPAMLNPWRKNGG